MSVKLFTVMACSEDARQGWVTFAKETGRTDARQIAKRLVTSPKTRQVIVWGPRDEQYVWTSPAWYGGGKWDVIDPNAPEEQCDHGLSLWLCADPINHYPADLSY